MGIRQASASVRQAVRVAAQPLVNVAFPSAAFHSGRSAVQEPELFPISDRSTSANGASTSDQPPKPLEDGPGVAGKHRFPYTQTQAAFDSACIGKDLGWLTQVRNQHLSPSYLHSTSSLPCMPASCSGSSFSTSALLAASSLATSTCQLRQTSEPPLDSLERLGAPSTSGSAADTSQENQAKVPGSLSQVRRPFKPRSKVDQLPADRALGARQLATEANVSAVEQGAQTAVRALPPLPPRKKVKALRKTAQHIMNILDQEAVAALKQKKNYPEFRAGDVVELDLIVPENRRRTAIIRGVCLSRRNAGVGSSFVIRRVVAGEGMEYTYPLYSPNIQSIKIIERRPVRRAKLYYLRDWNPQECTV